MANGYFERGEIYWVSISDFGGNEVGGTRPGLIVSTDKLNTSGQVLVAYLTTSNKDRCEWCVPVDATGRHSFVKCDTLMTIQTNRLRGLAGTLNSLEQKLVDDVLEDVFDLGYADDTAIKEKESEIAGLNLLLQEVKTEVAGVKAEISKRDEEIAALKMEIEIWQKCYGRCMDMLVDVKVNADLSRRTAAPKVEEPPVEPVIEEPKQPEPPKEEPKLAVPEQETRLDINSCTATALKKIGFSLALARKIVESRPFSSVEDIKRINGLKSSMFKIMEPKLCCVPVKVEEVPEPVVKQEADPVFEKINVNTASAKELSEALGLSMNACFAITGKRKREGLFTSLEQIVVPKRFSEGMLEKYRHLLEV
jgi:DNA uptake protein ComE-like DNA-binding protein/mRNA-degrading endonuclease toxin of MazEF toxin-antitoxin module